MVKRELRIHYLGRPLSDFCLRLELADESVHLQWLGGAEEVITDGLLTALLQKLSKDSGLRFTLDAIEETASLCDDCKIRPGSSDCGACITSRIAEDANKEEEEESYTELYERTKAEEAIKKEVEVCPICKTRPPRAEYHGYMMRYAIYVALERMCPRIAHAFHDCGYASGAYSIEGACNVCTAMLNEFVTARPNARQAIIDRSVELLGVAL